MPVHKQAQLIYRGSKDGFKTVTLMINALMYLPHFCLSNQKSISKYLDVIQIFLGKNLVAGKRKEEKASYSNS